MRSLTSYILLALFSIMLLTQHAEAARFGGGRSFGVQRSHSSLFSQRSAHTAKPFSPQKNTTRKWGGLLGGLLVGGLLASLFMGHGLGAGLLSWLLVGAVVFILINLWRKHFSPSWQSSGNQNFQANRTPDMNYYANNTGGSTTTYSPNFDVEAFLRASKVTFIRLQAAYDQKNLADLREFTAPDIFAEIQMQLDERTDTDNHTEVRQLNADLLDMSKQAYGTIASVRFTGEIVENGVTSNLDEIWHFRQMTQQDPWLVIGIQQEVIEPR